MAEQEQQEPPEKPVETSQKFFRFFQHEITALQQQMDRLGDTALAGGERIDATEHCLAGIARLSSEVKDASVYLPRYDQRTYSQAIKALQERLDKTRATFAPKPKFSFKSTRKNASAISIDDQAASMHPNIPGYGFEPTSDEGSGAPSPPGELKDEDTQPAPEGGGGEEAAGSANKDGAEDREQREEGGAQNAEIRQPSFSEETRVSISNHTSVHIILPASAGHATTTGTLSQLRRCIVDLSVPTTSGRPFAGLTLKDIQESLIIGGHVGGSAHVTGLTDVVIVVACRQFRMHDCSDCDVYLQSASRPIIEGSSGIRFAPLPATYTSESERYIENQWDKVDDFNWQREERSPNWTTLPQKERVKEDTWTYYVAGGPDHGLEDILKAVGVDKP